jgi:hypothetical protein
MVMERAERQSAELVTGISNVAYDLITLLQNKLEAITACEVYKQDAQEAGNARALSVLEHCQDVDRAFVQRLRRLLAEELGASLAEEEHDERGTPVQRGGDLSSIRSEEVVDDASEDSFPASDPPSFSGTTT